MKIVGVSGGIGSGKSMVCRVFSALGIPVYSADERAKYLTNNDLLLKNKIKNLLGNEAYAADGSYDRAWVAKQVFNNADRLQELNALIHPRVQEDTEQWASKNQQHPYIVKEAALFKKTGVGNNLDFLIVVISPISLRMERLKQRDTRRSEQEILDIMARQLSDEERIENADFIVYNNETRLLVPQIWNLHNKLIVNG